jgi:hypothetical protein
MTLKIRFIVVIAIVTVLYALTGCGGEEKAPENVPDTQPPRVVETFPLNGSRDVDPAITEISVTFNEEMMDGSWAWAYTRKEDFPRAKGQTYYTENNTKIVLPVILEPDKEYEIWINSEKHRGFKDKSGNSAVPFVFKFKTK